MKFSFRMDGLFDKWQAAEYDRNSTVAGPPPVDPARGNFILRRESRTFELRFESIVFDKIGVRGHKALKDIPVNITKRTRDATPLRIQPA